MQRNWVLARDWKSKIPDLLTSDESGQSMYDEPWHLREEAYTHDSQGHQAVVYEVDARKLVEHVESCQVAWQNFFLSRNFAGSDEFSNKMNTPTPPCPGMAYFKNELSNATKLVAVTERTTHGKDVPTIPWAAIKGVYDWHHMKIIWTPQFVPGTFGKCGPCTPLLGECLCCKKPVNGRTTCTGSKDIPHPPYNMSPWMTPFPELQSQIELWTVTVDNEWCLRLYWVDEVKEIRDKWQVIRLLWNNINSDSPPFYPSAIWFPVWMYCHTGKKFWKQTSHSSEVLGKMLDSWRDLDDMLTLKIKEKQDTSLSCTIEARAFLLTSMIAILEPHILTHMKYWLLTPKGTVSTDVDPLLLGIRDLQKAIPPKYANPVRPEEIPPIYEWRRRAGAAPTKAWTQMMFVHRPDGH